jgi:hypothetical protein
MTTQHNRYKICNEHTFIQKKIRKQPTSTNNTKLEQLRNIGNKLTTATQKDHCCQ